MLKIYPKPKISEIKIWNTYNNENIQMKTLI